MEKRIIDVPKKLKNKKIISENKYEDLYPQALAFYTVALKFKTLLRNVAPPFCPILSALGTLTYKLSKSFVPLLTPLTLNEYTIKKTHFRLRKSFHIMTLI